LTYFLYLKKFQVKIKKSIHIYNQINRELCILINKKQNHKQQLKIKLKKSRDRYRSRILKKKHIKKVINLKNIETQKTKTKAKTRCCWT